jgi:hypothetical protein
MEKNVARKRGKVRREESDQDHGQRQAERIIQEMLAALMVDEVELLAARKGDWRKRLIGQRVRADTSVSLRWLAGRLKMGSEGHLSRIRGSLADLVDHPGRRSFERTLQQDARKKDWGCIELTDSGLGVKTRGSPHENTDKKAGS